MNRKIKILISLFILLIIFFVIFFIRYIILSSVERKYNNSVQRPNYSYTYNSEKININFWKKDNIIKQEIKNDSSSIIIWKNLETNEKYTIREINQTYVEDAGGINQQPIRSSIIDNSSKIKLALNLKCTIRLKKYDNIECWYIKQGKNEVYINKSNGISLYLKEDNEIEKNTYEADCVTDNDVKKPDISKYEKN